MKRHYAENRLSIFLKVGYSLRSFPRLPHNGLGNCCSYTDLPFVPTPGKSAQSNCGAYLVEGLASDARGAPHASQDIAGGDEASHSYAGGVAEGWNAPPLDAL